MELVVLDQHGLLLRLDQLGHFALGLPFDTVSADADDFVPGLESALFRRGAVVKNLPKRIKHVKF